MHMQIPVACSLARDALKALARGLHNFRNEMSEYAYADTSTPPPSLARDVLEQRLGCTYLRPPSIMFMKG